MRDRNRPMIDQLPRAVYVAEGGELPEFESHYLRYQERQRKIAGAVLRTMASYAERTRTDTGLAHALELEELAELIEQGREQV